MAFLPRDFVVPATLQTPRWTMRSITVDDVVKDYDAVMSSRPHLQARFGKIWGWPTDDMTLSHNLMHLGWHQHEFELRSSFDYAVMSLDDRRLLGCVYIDPPHPDNAGVDAEIWYWARQSELASGLEEEIGNTVAAWLASNWPFKRVFWMGAVRDLRV